MHPGLLRYSSREEIDQRLTGLRTAWAQEGTFRDRLLALTRVTASVKCGHTYPSPYNGGREIAAQMYPDRSLVPFAFKWVDRRMVVTADHSGGLFSPGDCIEAVDGNNTAELLAKLLPLARADGGNDAKRVSLMEMRGASRFETFDIHLPLVLPLQGEARFDLSDGRSVRAPLLDLAARQSTLPEAESDDGVNPWTLTEVEPGVHRLIMPTWGVYDATYDWRAWLDGSLDAVVDAGSRALIVDLRGNEGGLDCGNEILARCIERDMPLARTQTFVSYRSAPEVLRPQLETWDKGFLDWGERASESAERPGFFKLAPRNPETDRVIKPAGRRFQGRLIVLCDASNSSATFNFAQLVKDHGLGTLVGEPTGGNRRGINGGAFCFLRLPASRIVVDLPLIASFPDTPQPDAAVEPDVYVAPSPNDIRLGRDRVLETALALLR